MYSEEMQEEMANSACLPVGCDQEPSSSSQSSEMPNLCYNEDAYITEETSMWPTEGFSAVLTSTAATTTTNVATVSFPATVKRPVIDAFPGQFDFNIQPSRHQEDAHWVYSELLGKVFTDIGKSVRFNVTLRADWTPSTAFFIRALLVFLSDDESFEEVVKTCPTHQNLHHTLNAVCPSVNHVVRCSDPQTYYQTDPESGRYSVVTQLSAPQPGATGVTLLYTFVCKNSCRGGIGRRALGLVFTLEDVSGEILGRCVFEVRVCSCPSRDKAKEEIRYQRINPREESGGVQVERKATIQQLVHVSRSQSPQEVPEVVNEEQRDLAQRCDNVPSKLSSCIIGSQGQQDAQPCIKLPIPLSLQREMLRYGIAIMWRDAGEKKVLLSESDTLILQSYREGC